MRKSILPHAVLLAMAGAMLPSFAHAHGGEAGGFLQGLTHPATGLDHVCAMLAVGLWAAQMGGRSRWIVPVTFVSVMALGGALPLSGIPLPFVEQGVLLSVLPLGILIFAAVRMPLWLGCSVVGLFALWHGHAHGAEMPALASGFTYVLGFVLATALMHAIGIVFGLAMQRLAREAAIQFAGAGIAMCGVYIAVGALAAK